VVWVLLYFLQRLTAFNVNLQSENITSDDVIEYVLHSMNIFPFKLNNCL